MRAMHPWLLLDRNPKRWVGKLGIRALLPIKEYQISGTFGLLALWHAFGTTEPKQLPHPCCV